jgi:D-alanyl-D-alanine dipeptidase
MGYGIDSEAVQGCPVEALQAVEDAEALQFEQHSGGFGAVNIDGLTASTSLALARFQRAVVNAGGAIAITSAYRPAAYQEHLRNVWEKWMVELRYNTDPLCQGLRAEVRDEFSRHSLLESQRPVVMSDHTRGLSFDAAVQLPRLKKSRLTVDLLASRAGVRRPDIARDPVHFRLAF